ncbi:MAG: glycosyltransferase, partial [Roseovarius sp.]
LDELCLIAQRQVGGGARCRNDGLAGGGQVLSLVLSVATRESTLWRERHIMPALLRRTYPRADGIIAVSDGIADDLRSYLSLPHDRVTVINNPALTQEVLARSEQPADHHWLDNPATARETIISVGRLDRQKDFPTLIRAFAQLREAEPALRLVIVGEGRERANLESLVQTLGLTDCVDLPGFRTNPWAFMRRAALFVSSSAWEGFGNVHVEALGCGCPVVSTDSPSGPADILEQGRIGPLVPIGDIAALTQAMRATLDNPLPKETLKARAMDFHIDSVIKRYCALMQI